METKVCKACGRELPETNFPISKGGIRISTCRECRSAAMRETKASRRAQMGGVKPLPFLTLTSTDRQSATFGALCAARRSGLKAVGV